jgi:hypothetical protein
MLHVSKIRQNVGQHLKFIAFVKFNFHQLFCHEVHCSRRCSLRGTPELQFASYYGILYFTKHTNGLDKPTRVLINP